jgi:6-phosphogluconolactonase (cycloisomerase 2 family)
MLYSPGVQNFATQSTTLGGIPPQAFLLDVRDLSPLWSADLNSIRDGIFPKDEKSPIDPYQPGNALYLSPALVFAPDRDALYIVHADSNQLTTVDFSAQNVETVEIQDRLSWVEQLLSLTAGVAHAKVMDGTTKQAAISPDGQFLYLIGVNSESSQDELGNWQMNQTPLGVEIIQTSDGSRIMHIESDAADLSLSPDGRFLYLRNWGEDVPWTEAFDTSSRQITDRKMGIYASPALRMNGQFVLASTYSSSETLHHMGILEPDGLGTLLEWTGPHYIGWLRSQ